MASKHVCEGILAALLVAGTCGVIASACAHDDTTIFVRDVLAQTPVAAGQQCIVTSDPTQPFITQGTLDVPVRAAYDAVFLVGNQLVPQGNPATPATETSFVNIQGAVVRITDSSGNQLTTYTRLAGATIPPSVGTTASYAPIEITIVDENTAGMYLPLLVQGELIRVVTYTRFFGMTLGGQSVESNEFEFPVDLCAGCLVQFPMSDEDPDLPEPNCFAAGSSATTATTVPCFVGEDLTFPCSVCPAGIPECHNSATDAGTD